jgi:hypothetical protein
MVFVKISANSSLQMYKGWRINYIYANTVYNMPTLLPHSITTVAVCDATAAE